MKQTIVFSKQWFAKHQSKLLFLLNAPIIKYWFRYCLRIRKCDCPLKERISNIQPSNFTFAEKTVLADHLIFKDGHAEVFDGENSKHRKLKGRLKIKKRLAIQKTTDFRTHDKFSKRLYYAFKPLWFLMHGLDWAFLDRMNALSKLSFGFSTLTQYPGSIGVDNPVDGSIQRNNGGSETLSTLRAGAGTDAFTSNAGNDCYIKCSSTTDEFQILRRSTTCFDTSGLTSGATISATVISCYGSSSNAFLGTPVLHVAQGNVNGTSTLISGDYAQANHGTTSFGNIPNGSFSMVAYNNITFDATGRASVSKDSISIYSWQLGWDIENTTAGLTWTSGWNTYMAMLSSNTAGTTNDPKLVVTYTVAAADTGNFLQLF